MKQESCDKCWGPQDSLHLMPAFSKSSITILKKKINDWYSKIKTFKNKTPKWVCPSSQIILLAGIYLFQYYS